MVLVYLPPADGSSLDALELVHLVNGVLTAVTFAQRDPRHVLVHSMGWISLMYNLIKVNLFPDSQAHLQFALLLVHPVKREVRVVSGHHDVAAVHHIRTEDTQGGGEEEEGEEETDLSHGALLCSVLLLTGESGDKITLCRTV